MIAQPALGAVGLRSIWRALMVLPGIILMLCLMLLPAHPSMMMVNGLVERFGKERCPPLTTPVLMAIVHWTMDTPVKWKVRVFVEGHATLLMALCAVALRFEHSALPSGYWPVMVERLAIRAAAMVAVMLLFGPLCTRLRERASISRAIWPTAMPP